MATKQAAKKMSVPELDALHKVIAEGIATLHAQSETGKGGRARILFYALAMYLDERGIIDDLKAAATWADKQQQVKAQRKASKPLSLGQRTVNGILAYHEAIKNM